MCKHIKKVRSSQLTILVLNWRIKHSFSLWMSLTIYLHKFAFVKFADLSLFNAQWYYFHFYKISFLIMLALSNYFAHSRLYLFFIYLLFFIYCSFVNIFCSNCLFKWITSESLRVLLSEFCFLVKLVKSFLSAF